MEEIIEKQKRIDLQQDNISNRLDGHESNIGNIRIDLAKNSQQQQVMIDSLSELKQELRQEMKNIVSLEFPKIARKVIREEIRLLSKNNPKKRIEGKIGLMERIKLLFKLNK